VIPELILTSDALRAHTTALAVAEAAEYTGDIRVDPMLYLAGPDDILAVLKSLPDGDAATVMIVGHNPGLEDLIERLTGAREEMPTAALARLALPIDLWADLDDSRQATLVNIWRPHEIWP
jgi:phosphohistidine phosphatase